VFNGKNLQDVLDQLAVSKDVDLPAAPVLWTHRVMPGRDIYFLSNQSDKYADIRPVFRVTGRQPQLWDAVTGEIRQLSEYSQTAQGTAVAIRLEAGQSQFVVFAEKATADVHRGYESNFPQRKRLMTVPGPWKVKFDNPVIGVHEKPAMDTLIDWSRSGNDSIKHYSGTAHYTTELMLDEVPEDKDLFVNLGQVHVMAEVTVNGQPAGGVWMAPYVLNVTDMMRPGKNILEIEVVNLWRNYLVREHGMPQDQRKTWLTVSDIRADEALQPSGLIGPVILETIDRK
jgi:hypothetical protein